MVGILLDTCVLSELERPLPNPTVRQHVSSLSPEQVFLSVVTIGELLKGILLLENGARRRGLTTWLEGLKLHYASHILSVDLAVAHGWAQLTSNAQKQGIVIPAADGLIAATALRHGMPVMTRNTKHFAAASIEVIDPWNP